MRPDYRIPPADAVTAELARRAAFRQQIAALVRPQPGPQEIILSTPADIGIIGGSVFGGKTWALVVEPLRHVDVPGFTCVAFRREMPEITNPGGLWDETEKWYPQIGGVPKVHTREWVFPSGSTLKCAGLQYDSDLIGWLGSQACLFLFDQLETFTEKMFFAILARNRSGCGVRPYVRGSCNPDADSFLVHLLAWWIDDKGWALPDRSGVIRWFLRINETVEWAETTCAVADYDQYEARRDAATEEFERRYPGQARTSTGEPTAKSLTFVLARLQDNAIGRALDPTYEANVRALALVDRERLLGGDRGGNWKVRPTSGKVFNRAWFTTTLATRPTDVAGWVRYWDKAGTEGGGKYSAGVLMGRRSNGRFVVADVVRGQWSALHREVVIKQTAEADARLTPSVGTWVEQEPGSGGKESAESTVRNLAGFTIHAERVTGDKVTRANPYSAQVEAGNVDLIDAPWHEAYLAEHHAFDGVRGVMDQVDASSGAFNKLTLGARPDAWSA